MVRHLAQTGCAGDVAPGRGPRFGAEGRGFARLTMGTSPELIEEAVRRMASAL